MKTNKLSDKKRVDFYSFIATLVERGKNPQEACEEVAQIIDQKAAKAGVFRSFVEKEGDLYKDVAFGIRRGKNLANVLSGRIPDAELMMLVAGGEGNNSASIRAAQKEAVNAKALRDTVISGVLYPSGIFLALLALLYWLGQNLFPEFVGLLPVKDWPSKAQTVFWLSTHIYIWFPITMGALVGLFLLCRTLNKRLLGPKREILHHIPPFNVVRAMTGANFLSTLANLLAAGEPMKESLERMNRNSTSPYLSHYVGKVLQSTRAGKMSDGPGAALQIPLFRMWTQVELEVYGRGSTEEFSENIEFIADQAREKAKGTVHLLSRLLNLLMMMLAGAMIFTSVSAMYAISTSINAAY
ncbi:hypothetical protein EZI54_06855 [Marinobacter halodurans]|uniref:Type II secretion system protein GspF domain-containing protein n=1 Tax=Marinobacter halodurans TaxID=2528979 RepID=A0ABY1ZM35_9GAMM|nr:type II secretion system F family protein [Marinobacter halodurans]TBW57370.1 hypothetical protein EZI54_06855 [Marinobacter halodurans]